MRAALGWFIRYRENSVQRRIERAIVAASSADDAENIAVELSQRHYLGVFRRHRSEFHTSVVTEGYPLTGQKEALALAVQTVADLLGQEAVGSDRLAEALGNSFGYAAKYQDEIEALARYMAAENIKRELAGQPLIGNASLKHTIDSDIEAIREVDFVVICRVRDVLALLAEASMIYEAVKGSLHRDPMVRHLLDFFTSSPEAHHWVSAAAPLAYTAPAESWKWMSSVTVMICSDADDLTAFEEVARRIDFTLDDIRSLAVRRPKKKSRAREMAKNARGPAARINVADDLIPCFSPACRKRRQQLSVMVARAITIPVPAALGGQLGIGFVVVSERVCVECWGIAGLRAPAVLASLLGVHIQTAVNWASHTRRDWTTYIADRVSSPAPRNTARSE